LQHIAALPGAGAQSDGTTLERCVHARVRNNSFGAIIVDCGGG
jgi:hypothetical protein